MNMVSDMKRFFLNNDGGILMMAAIAIPVLLTAVGFAVDLNRYMKSSGYIQSAVDQAAIASVAVDGQDRNEIARRFFEASLTDDVRQYIALNNIRVDESFPPGGPLSVTVIADVSMTNVFGGVVGISTIELTKLGQATRAVENVEAVITMASNGTMCSHKSRVPNTRHLVQGDTLLRLTPDPQCVHFEAMKQGVREFVDIVESNETVADVKVGLVPYNHKVRMPDLNNIPPSLTANEPAGYYESMRGAEPISPVLPLTSNINAVERAIGNLRQTERGRAWSRSDLASHVAGLMLNPTDSRYFPGGERPSAFDDPTTQKIIIMMTDGSNIGCCFTNWPLGDFNGQYVYFYEPYNRAQTDICEILKANNVKIFSILFDVSETDPGGQQINNIFARCASGAYAERGAQNDSSAMLTCSNKQYCYNVTTDEELIKAYRQIAQTFYNPRITQ